MTVALPRDRPKPRTFPAANLIGMFSADTPVIAIASAFNSDKTTIHGWIRKKTRLSVWSADRYACQIGLHPSAVWPETWYD